MREGAPAASNDVDIVAKWGPHMALVGSTHEGAQDDTWKKPMAIQLELKCWF